MFWGYLIVTLVVSALLYAALKPARQSPQAAVLEDFDVPKAKQGDPVPVVFGTVTIRSPTVIWYGDLKTYAIHSSGGKK